MDLKVIKWNYRSQIGPKWIKKSPKGLKSLQIPITAPEFFQKSHNGPKSHKTDQNVSICEARLPLEYTPLCSLCIPDVNCS